MTAIGTVADIDTHWHGEEVEAEVNRNLARGLKAAAIFLTGRVKESLSVPAPRVRVALPGRPEFYAATAPNTPGAPARKLSGRLRQTITYEVKEGLTESAARVGTNLVYSRAVELGYRFPRPRLVQVWYGSTQENLRGRWIRVKGIPPHPYLTYSLAKNQAALGRIIEGAV